MTLRSLLLLFLVLASSAHAAPTVQWFTATPTTIAPGGSTTLRWHVDGATEVSISPGIGMVNAIGQSNIQPGASTEYTLLARNADGDSSVPLPIVVGAGPPRVGGRFVELMSPLDEQHFTAPASLRLFAAAYDPSVTSGCGASGDRCADRVDFFVDAAMVLSVGKAQAEYWVFKGSAAGIAAGTHRVYARAFYSNPTLVLESESKWITVAPAPVYAQTIELTQDLNLSGSQDWQIIAPPGQRIRVNGNGHRVVSSGNWSGRLRLSGVDFFGLGMLNDATPAVALETNAEVRIEDCVFDSSGTVDLSIHGSAPVNIVGNEFRSNMRMPAAQQPEFGADASYPAFRTRGTSTGTKVFAGNRIGLGWADFRNASRWTIGGDTPSAGNIVIGPRAGIWAQNLSQSRIARNIVYQVYFGGWSQGNLMEVGNSADLIIEHNVIGGGSWPIRGLGGELRYNLVLDAGHQWLWITDDDASVHHNVFVGGEGDVAPIWLIYQPQRVRLYNNTLDGLGIASMRNPIWVGEGAQATVHSNAITGMRNPPGIEIDGALAADYNLFSGQTGTPRNYSDNRHPAHDIGALNAQVDPHFAETGEPLRNRLGDWWSRRISVTQTLASYRTRYTPASSSPLIDAGMPGQGSALFANGFEAVSGVAGNDIGAVGAGTVAADDLFGR